MHAVWKSLARWGRTGLCDLGLEEWPFGIIWFNPQMMWGTESRYMLTCLRQCNDLRGWGKFRAWSPLGALGNCAICFWADHKHRHYRIDLRANEATGQGSSAASTLDPKGTQGFTHQQGRTRSSSSCRSWSQLLGRHRRWFGPPGGKQ